MTRVKNWWARDRKFYRFRDNPDYIVYTVTGSMDKAFELFRQGKLDFFPLSFPRYCIQCEIEEIYRATSSAGIFTTTTPALRAEFTSTALKPLLDNLDVRLGINYSRQWKKVLETIFAAT
jgi:microcin C transport system substrate-binding protein